MTKPRTAMSQAEAAVQDDAVEKRGLDRELERYELDEGPVYSFEVGRRSFLGIAGAGLLIATTEGCSPVQSLGQGGPAGTVAARLHISSENGAVTVFTSKVEVGQGSRTQITQAVAEELKLSVDQVRLVMADSSVVPDDGGTAGSRTTPRTIPAVRKDAAAARAILIKLAAGKWGADPETLEARDGAVLEPGTNRRVTYAELAESAEAAEAFSQQLPDDVKLTAVKQWSVLGTSLSKRDSRDIVTGTHRYPSDVARPNMLYGKVLRPPSFGATLASIDLAAAEKMEGVTAVRDGNFAGCAAPTSRLAQQAVEALAGAAKWDSPPHPSSKELFPYLKEHAVTEGEGRRKPRRRTKGSAETAMAGSKRRLSAAYEVAYVQHAPMEPRAAVAEWDNGRLTVWTGTQQPSRVQGQLAEAFRVPLDKVRLIVPDTGGGFGGKHTGEVAVEAARLAKAAKRPVSLRWTRPEELTWAYFRPAGLIEIEAGLDEKNSITAWNFANYNSGASAIESPYDIPNTQTQFFYADSPLREGSYRALASTANCFARESFMDELAASAGADPLAFRLAHLTDDRLRAVLEAAAERFNWQERRKSRQRPTGIGLSCGIEKGSYVAACAEVEADRAQGKIKVVEIVQAFECGAIQNPANLRAQVEGSIIMGLGGALTEEIRFENGRISNALFADYRVPRFKDVPRIETILLDRPDLPSVGGSETPIIAVAPAIGNAVFDATGVRLRAMPMRGEGLIES